jgi:hypothetical protein
VNYPRALCSQRQQRLGHRVHQGKPPNADDLKGRCRWIGQWAKQVETCRHPEFAPDCGDARSRAVVERRKHKTHSNFI